MKFTKKLKTSLLTGALLSLLTGALLFSVEGNAAKEMSIDVWKSPTCSCCKGWIKHLKKNGFEVTIHESNTKEMSAIKTKLGVDKKLRACHTARIDGMTVEGHVKASDIIEALERKDIKMLSVPNMPAGSPGMETSGPKQKYQTIGINKESETFIFKNH